MSEDKEAFLSRWSRLKREQLAEEAKPPIPAETPAPALPPVETLTPQSDFTGFMHPKVKDELRRVALKKLFSDAHFNVPDPFEPFSGDWTVAETITPELLAQLNQAQTLLFTEQDKDKEKQSAAEPAQGEAAKAPLVAESQIQEGESKQDEPRRQDA